MSEVSILDPNHPDLIAFYTMDNIVGNTLVDEIGSNDLTLYSSTTQAGVIGDAIGFSASSGAAQTNQFSELSELSDSFWAYIPSSPGVTYLTWFGYGENNTSLGIAIIDINNIRLAGRQNVGDSFTTFVSGDIPSEGWHHFILEESSSGKSLYVDNDLLLHSPITGNAGISYACMGNNYARSQVAAGYLYDQRRIFNRSLTAAERTTLYEEPWPYEARGLVSVDGTPLSTELRLYNAATGELVDIVNSDASGAYQKTLATADPLYVMAVEPDGYRPLVHGPINPSLRNQS